MKVLDIIFWAFFAFTVGFIAWQFMRLLFEALWDRPVRRSRTTRFSGMGGVSGGEASSAFGDTGTASDANAAPTSSESNGGDSATGDMSGGGEYGGGGASGGW